MCHSKGLLSNFQCRWALLHIISDIYAVMVQFSESTKSTFLPSWLGKCSVALNCRTVAMCFSFLYDVIGRNITSCFDKHAWNSGRKTKFKSFLVNVSGIHFILSGVFAFCLVSKNKVIPKEIYSICQKSSIFKRELHLLNLVLVLLVPRFSQNC